MGKSKKKPNKVKKIEAKKEQQRQEKKQKNQDLFLIVITLLITTFVMKGVEMATGFSYNMATDGFSIKMFIDLGLWLAIAAVSYVGMKWLGDFFAKRKQGKPNEK